METQQERERKIAEEEEALEEAKDEGEGDE